MPSPSDYEWWQWLLMAFGAGIAGAFALKIGEYVEEETTQVLAWPFWGIAIVGFFGSAGLVVIGLIRLVKWAWNG